MKTFDKPYIRVLDHLLGREKHLSVFFPNSLFEIPQQCAIICQGLLGELIKYSP